MANNYEKESKEGYDAGKRGDSADSNPHKNDTITGRMVSIIGDVLTGNALDSTQEQDRQSDAWKGSHDAGKADRESK